MRDIHRLMPGYSYQQIKLEDKDIKAFEYSVSSFKLSNPFRIVELGRRVSLTDSKLRSVSFLK